MAFRTKLDFSSNRQVKQHEKTITALSGATSFGLPYSAMTSGPDLNTSAITQTFVSITGYTSTFSGNNTTTNYNWFDNRMVLGESMLSAITNTTSATTQITKGVYTAATNTTIDGNLVNLTYTGVSYNIRPLSVFNLGGGNYSGTVRTYKLDILSASTLDFTGRTIWADVSGITRTERLIITNNPQIGYVWTCVDSEGMGEWQYNGSGPTTTIWTAGTGANSAVLGGSNIIGSLDNTVYAPNLILNTGGTSSNLGINTSNPNYVIDAYANLSRLYFNDKATGADALARQLVLSATSVNISQVAAATNSSIGGLGLSLSMGVFGDNITPTVNSVLIGNAGDSFINSSTKTNNLNIVNLPTGGGSNNIRLYAGVSVDTATTSDLHIQGTGTTRGYIGIKTDNPSYLIDARGTNNRFFYSSAGLGSINISATTGLPSIGVTAGTSNTANNSASVSFGARAWDDSTYTVYGYQGDAFIYAGIYTNGLNIISNDGSTLGTGADYIRFYAGQSTGAGFGNNPDLHIQGSGTSRGYVAINIPSNQDPTQRLDVNGNARFRSIGSSASAGALHYTADGTLTTNTSDERLKTNITTLTNALDRVNQLRGVSYNWTENPTGDTRIGFVAQEVNSVVPELTFVNPNSSENYMGVHYDNVTALLVEAVKELSSGITTSNNTHLETQTILAEDNNIELNYSGTPETAIGGGIRVLHALGNDNAAELITDIDGNFVTNNDFKSKALTIPFYTPTSSNDTAGSEGNITRDDNYMYVKCLNKWKRINLENF